jgi:NAD(P)-dependent dehydrogenase (short-subunit alcohol dehydrogenase family)
VSNLNGRRAIITGGSRGIGRGITQALLEAGATCCVITRSGASGASDHGDVKSSVHYVAGDITREADCVRAVEESATLLGGLDVVVNCAGRVAGTNPDRVMTALDSDVLADFDEKVLGTLRMARAARTLLAESGSGRIINIGGAGARIAGNVSSGARNAALVHLSRSLALEFGQDGITVNTIHPGVTLTETVMDRLRTSSGERPVEELIKKLGDENAIRRMITPADIGAVAAFLASVASGGMTGEVLAVTGGSNTSVYY